MQVGPLEIRIREPCRGQVGVREIGPGQARPIEACPRALGPHPARTVELAAGKDRGRAVGVGEDGHRAVGGREIGGREAGPGKPRGLGGDPAGLRLGEVCPAEPAADESRAAEIMAAAPGAVGVPPPSAITCGGSSSAARSA